MKKKIGSTNNQYDVYIIIDNEHMMAHSDVTEELIAEAVSKVDYSPTFWMDTIDLGHITGRDTCVETTALDDIRYECRPGRKVKSRMVYGREPNPTTLLTIGLCTEDDGLVTVFTAFPGQKVPKEVDDPSLQENERAEAEVFWATHALCAEGQVKNTVLPEPVFWYELRAIDDAYSVFIDQEVCVIGRAAELKDYLKDKMYVSRRHAKLTIKSKGVVIENLSATGTTCINNEAIDTATHTTLADGDEIGLGGRVTDGKRKKEAAYFIFRGPFQR